MSLDAANPYPHDDQAESHPLFLLVNAHPRLALANLHRPGAQTGRLVVALGLGLSLFTMLAVIETNLSEIRKSAAFSSKERFNLLKERIEKIMSTQMDDTRLYSEVAVYADKIDINEEMTRLSDHIRKFRETAKEKGQIGKKLDFIAQEMFREANTIGSKTPSSDIAHRAVEIKNNIEKIREQCRNVV